MELTTEDKQRIEQEADRLWTLWLSDKSETCKEYFFEIAEYATIYERHECDKIIERATSDSMDTIVMLDQKVKSLEAERIELRNKVIEECLWFLGCNSAVPLDESQRQILNSLKTK